MERICVVSSPEVIPVSTTSGTIVSLPHPAMSITPNIVTTVSDLPHPHVRTALVVEPGVVTSVLVIGHRVLTPTSSLAVPDEVDGDVLPVIIMTMIHSEWITTLLMTIPHLPGQLQIVSTNNSLVVDWSISIESLTHSIVFIGGKSRITILISSTIKPCERKFSNIKMISGLYQPDQRSVLERPVSGAHLRIVTFLCNISHSFTRSRECWRNYDDIKTKIQHLRHVVVLILVFLSLRQEFELYVGRQF